MFVTVPQPDRDRVVPNESDEQRAESPGCGSLLFAAIALLFGVGLITNLLTDSGDSSDNRYIDNPDGGGIDDDELAVRADDGGESAYHACKLDLIPRLQAPRTASFPDYWDLDPKPSRNRGPIVRVSETVGSLTIGSYVDAEDGFGVEARTPWTCTAHEDTTSAYGWSVTVTLAEPSSTSPDPSVGG